MAVSTNSGRVIKMTAASDATIGYKDVNFAVWYAPNASANDECVITDGADATIGCAVADATNFQAVIPMKVRANGIKLPTMATGTLFIYLAPNRHISEAQY